MEIPKTYLYKVSRNGNYLGILPNVVSDFEYIQNINTAGVEVTIKIGNSPDDPMTGDTPIIGDSESLVQNGNDIEIIESSNYSPNGKTVFTGYISTYRSIFGGSDDVEILAISYG